MKSGTETKAKFKKLQRRLKLNLWQCTGLLESIWRATVQNSPCGDLGRLSNEDIASVIEWEGDADELILALVECGWLDRCERNRLVVHDWEDHCPTFIRGNMAKHNKEFAVAKHVAKQPAMEPAKQLENAQNAQSEVATNSIQFNPNQTNTNPSAAQPNQTGSGASAPGGAKPKTPPKEKPIEPPLVIPEGLDYGQFPDAWASWLEYRTERKLTKTRRTLLAQLRALEHLGAELAAECIQQSVQNGWQGLFPDRMNGHRKSSRANPVESEAVALQRLKDVFTVNSPLNRTEPANGQDHG